MEYASTIHVGPESSDTYEYIFYPEPRQLDTSIQVVNAETTESIPNVHIEVYSRNMANPYKPAFNEGLDFSCAVFDADAEMIGQAEFCPAQIGAMPFIVEWCVEEMGKDAFNPGDVVIHNDPYRR